MMIRPIAAFGVLAILLWGVSAAAFTPGSSANPLITQTINVQIIDVCGTGASNNVCAPTAPVTGYETFANSIYAQAGTAFSFNKSIEKIHLGGTSSCDGGAASTVCSDQTGATLFDTVHTLVDTAGNGQSPVANTLNVYLVKNLMQTGCSPGPLCSPIYGWGLIGGNGAVVATGTNPLTGLIAAPDVVAHELGHNLGLYHVDQPPLSTLYVDPTAPPGSPRSIPAPLGTYGPGEVPVNTPYNLMNTGSRAVTVLPCAVTPYTCTGAPQIGRDQLLPFQVSTLRNSPLRNDLPAVEAAVPGGFQSLTGISPRGCSNSFTVCETGVGFVGPITASLDDVRYRFLDPTVGVKVIGASTMLSTQFISTSTGLHEQLSLALDNPWHTIGYFSPNFIYGPAGCTIAQTCRYSTPFSTEFDFSNGVTSEAGFDETGHFSQITSEAGYDETGHFSQNGQVFYFSQNGQVFGFDPSAPGVVNGPSLLPSLLPPPNSTCTPNENPYLCWEDTDSYGALPSQVIGIGQPLSFGPAAVPEPGSFVLLAAGIGGLAATRRRWSRR